MATYSEAGHYYQIGELKIPEWVYAQEFIKVLDTISKEQGVTDENVTKDILTSLFVLVEAKIDNQEYWEGKNLG